MKREFVSTEVYVRADAERFRPDEITEIPAGMYQCIYCSSFDTEKELACKLLDQVEKNGYTLQGIISVRLLWKHLFLRRMKEECFCGFRCL